MARSIVCGIDDSIHARAAARVAGDLADRLGLPLVVVHAMSLPAGAATDAPAATLVSGDAYEVQERHAAQTIARVLRSSGAGHARVRMEVGAVAERLDAVGEEEDAALLAIGTRGPGSLRQAFLGSAAATLFRTARRPVLAVPPQALPGGHPVAGPVVAAIRGPADARWIRLAADLASAYDVPLLLAHVLEDDGSPSTRGGKNARAHAAVEAFDAARRALGTAGSEAATYVRFGRPGQALLDIASELDATLLVAGTRGQGALRARIAGSTARHLACEAEVPVVICPPHVQRGSGHLRAA